MQLKFQRSRVNERKVPDGLIACLLVSDFSVYFLFGFSFSSFDHAAAFHFSQSMVESNKGRVTAREGNSHYKYKFFVAASLFPSSFFFLS